MDQTCSATLAELGRIGAKGQMMVHHFGREEEAVRLFLDLRRKKRRPGFRPPTWIGGEPASPLPHPRMYTFVPGVLRGGLPCPLGRRVRARSCPSVRRW
ncbi:WGR domain-containing protein [Sinorhizobium medicae]|uniref:WGR domain-containing protein n=1 Tax=Sinorhizobium medicae TaxID=110321 RepID=UPI001F389EF6|nr:WGR domain-containing protein [Sinorhizobium medicae]WQO48027.1 WGR domain-containing protein [Sinorhizobium medicae]WQO68381.1 WGR domain-containing protein [Sinorhizobium medicae]WQO75442.1 WGR domain-containing protein [Sinorhizobium medicae]WQO94637.1 WGR domain-containing protein [Sinorhizobium medicae]